MTGVAPTIDREGYRSSVSWTLASGQSGAPFDTDGWELESLVITGTFNTGTVTVQAANDDAAANSAGLKDRSNSAISTTAAAFYGLPDNARWVWPVATTVTGVIVDLFLTRVL